MKIIGSDEAGLNNDVLDEVSDLLMRSEAFRELSESQEVYCPFEALGVARQEIRHSNFLADIIDPLGRHGFGDLLLKSFIETLLGQAAEKELRLAIHLEDLSGAVILREWKRIDLLVRIPSAVADNDLVLVIEVKVEANESAGQLANYEDQVARRWPDAKILYYFLTPDHTASTRNEWTDVGFASVLDSFEDALKQASGHAKARSLVEAYISMMRNRYVENPKLEELARKIWSQHGPALEFLMEHQPNPASELLDAVGGDILLRKVNESLQDSGLDLSLVVDSKSSRLVRLAVPEWDALDGILKGERWVSSNRVCLFEIEVTPYSFGGRFVVGRGPKETRLSVIDAIDKAKINVKRSTTITPDFTRICSKSIRSKKEMQRLMKDGVDDDDIEKLSDDVANYLVSYIGPFNSALKENLSLQKGV
ncbi:PD-(D/E)XK nuclease family protein [Ruegeria sp. HKCCD4332]|uniref:PDDEXK-like family protein n=1 Tax=Ruegeria sp. HKCCD4332 TaxID=2683021 RepID=UPI0014915714|nr:PD-(D/E)XK nuclease family protein [Ruegeria sp. HKCCD4332]NOD75952.1 hypothetical protein [Ruegeria sp. HKCCD4332]